MSTDKTETSPKKSKKKSAAVAEKMRPHEKLKACIFAVLMAPNERCPVFSAYDGGFGYPAVLIGKPGIGKTSMGRQVAEALNVPCHVFPTESLQLQDLEGIPAVISGELKRCSDNPDVLSIVERGQGLLVFDELNTNKAGLDAAIRRVLQEHTWARRPLGPRVRVLAAMNPPECSMSGKPLSAPMANTLVHLHMEPHTWEAWAKYTTAASGAAGVELPNEADAMARLRAGWKDAYEQVAMETEAYFKTFSTKIHAFPENAEKASGPWPSERTWSMCFNLRVTAKALHLGPEVEEALMAATVGPEVASEFFNHIADLGLPTVEEALDGKWVIPAARPDVIYAVLGAAVRHLTSEFEGSGASAKQIDTALKAWQLVDKVFADESYKDLVIHLVSLLERRGFGSSLKAAADSNPSAAKKVDAIVSRLTPNFSLSLLG